MANEEQLEILKQGVEVWNRWRKSNPRTKINLGKAALVKAILSGAILNGADLYKADLGGTILCKADLGGANLRGTRLLGTKLSNATLTGAKLYGSARDDWQIDGVICDYVFWDKEGEQRTPLDRDFHPGEFEELYKQLPTFEYYFEQGFTPIDAVVMDRVVAAINEQHPEFNLDLVNFDKRGEPHATFTVLHKEAVEAAKQEVTRSYEERIAALEGKQEQMLELMVAMVNNPQKIEVIMGNKQISAGNDYIESIEGDNFASGGGNMNIAKDHGSATQSNEVN